MINSAVAADDVTKLTRDCKVSDCCHTKQNAVFKILHKLSTFGVNREETFTDFSQLLPMLKAPGAVMHNKLSI